MLIKLKIKMTQGIYQKQYRKSIHFWRFSVEYNSLKHWIAMLYHGQRKTPIAIKS